MQDSTCHILGKVQRRSWPHGKPVQYVWLSKLRLQHEAQPHLWTAVMLHHMENSGGMMRMFPRVERDVLFQPVVIQNLTETGLHAPNCTHPWRSSVMPETVLGEAVTFSQWTCSSSYCRPWSGWDERKETYSLLSDWNQVMLSVCGSDLQ